MEALDPRLEQEIALLHSHVCEGLGDPKRVLILYLLQEGPRSVGDLVKALGIPQPTVSHHLKVLRDRGLVLARRRGTTVAYSLADGRIIQALEIMRAMLADMLAGRARVVSRAP